MVLLLLLFGPDRSLVCGVWQRACQLMLAVCRLQEVADTSQ
jgi:hypothetical protein